MSKPLNLSRLMQTEIRKTFDKNKPKEGHQTRKPLTLTYEGEKTPSQKP